MRRETRVWHSLETPTRIEAQSFVAQDTAGSLPPAVAVGTDRHRPLPKSPRRSKQR